MSALTDRDANSQPTSHPSGDEKERAEGVENKTQMGEKAGVEKKYNLSDAKSGTYISPSDAILSPATKKLAEFKQKQINKKDENRKPAARTLFARTPSSCSSAGFGDVDSGEK